MNSENKTRAFFILAFFTILFSYAASKLEFRSPESGTESVYTVEIEYYGMDEDNIEHTITIPLEKNIMILPHIKEVHSRIENGKSFTSVYFSSNDKKNYLGLRNAVELTFKDYPSDVQRPRIYSASSDAKSSFSVAFLSERMNTGKLRNSLENTLKPRLMNIRGVAEVSVCGGTQEEICVEFDTNRLINTKLDPSVLAAVIQDANHICSGTEISSEKTKQTAHFDMRLHSLDELKKIPLFFEESYSELENIAEISISEREKDSLVRLNGRDCITLEIKTDFDASIIKVCKACKKIMKGSDLPYEYIIIHDSGENETALLKKLLIAVLISFTGVFLTIPVFFNRIKSLIFTVIFLLLTIIWTTGLMFFSGFSLNEESFLALCVALGLAADPFFVVNEIAFSAGSYETFRKEIKKNFPAMLLALLTTLLVLIPLYFLENLVSGVKTIAAVSGLMILCSLILALFFAPVFLYDAKNSFSILNKEKLLASKNRSIRFILRSSMFAVNKRKTFLLLQIIFCVFTVMYLCFGEKNLSQEINASYVECSLDYDSNMSAEYIDKDILDFTDEIKKLHGITYVFSECSQGNARIQAGLQKNTSLNAVSREIKSLSFLCPEAFVFIPFSENKAKRSDSLTVSFCAEDYKLCKKIASEAAQKLSACTFTDSVVLNFKPEASCILFRPDRILLSRNGLSVSQLSSMLRWMLFGPVADKWLTDGTERDIRIRGAGAGKASVSSFEKLSVPTKNGPVPLKALGEIEKSVSQGTIYRINGTRAASITVETSSISTSALCTQITKLCTPILHDGCTIRYPVAVEFLGHTCLMLILSLACAAVFLLLLLVAFTENLMDSLCICLQIPLSVFLPVFIRFITGRSIETGDIVSFILLSGLSVNNCIYIVSAPGSTVIEKLYNRLDSISSSTISSLIGAVPLMIAGGKGISFTLSFCSFFGLIGSYISCLVFFPALYSSVQTRNKWTRNIH